MVLWMLLQRYFASNCWCELGGSPAREHCKEYHKVLLFNPYNEKRSQDILHTVRDAGSWSIDRTLFFYCGGIFLFFFFWWPYLYMLWVEWRLCLCPTLVSRLVYSADFTKAGQFYAHQDVTVNTNIRQRLSKNISYSALVLAYISPPHMTLIFYTVWPTCVGQMTHGSLFPRLPPPLHRSVVLWVSW